MKIEFKHLQLYNFMSFKDAMINLTTEGYTLVSGVNQNPDDLAKSNGSGKSSIWEAISWCLTGETIRGSKEVKRIGAEDECLVHLDFKLDNDNYTVIRTKDPSKLEVYINNKNVSGKGIKDTQKILENLLPDLNSSLLGSVIILGQGLPQRFTNNTPSGRKEVLEKLSKSDFMITDIKDRISKRQSVLYDAIKQLDLESANCEGKKEQLNKTLEDLRKKFNDACNTEAIDEKIKYCKETVVKYDDLIATCEKELQEIKDREDRLTKEKNDILLNNMKKKEEVTNLLSEEINSAKLLYNEKKTEFDYKSKELVKLQNVKDVCPTCGQKLPGVSKPDTSQLEKELHNLCTEVNNLKCNYEEVNKTLNEQLNVIDNRFKDKLNELSIQLMSIPKEDSNKRAEYSGLLKCRDTYYKDQVTYEAYKDTLEKNRVEYSNSILNVQKEIEETSSKILYNNIEKESKNQHLDVIKKFSTVVTRDFRGYLLKGIIEYISKKSKEYSNIVFKTNKIDFYLDGNNISISYDNKPYEALSGGEKQKVDLIVQFAIRDMLCKYLGFSSNIIVLDEIFDNLDSEGCENILNLISTKLTDVQSIFIITHHQDLQIPMDNEIVVIKGQDKISRIE